MPVGEICNRDVIITGRNTTVEEAARLMRQHHVGTLVITDTVDGRNIPVGIVTDRDITVSVVGTNIDAGVFTVGDLVTDELVTVNEGQGIFECIHEMRTHGVRRMPVVDCDRGLVGILSVDDVIELLAEEMGELARLISNEQAREARKKK
jgi:predicted transcriptional regulator